MQWYDTNPNPDTFRGNAQWSAHKFGRQHFPSSFARNGFASVAFAATPGDALAAPWRRKHRYGSAKHVSNLRQIQAAHPNSAKINKAMAAAGKKTSIGAMAGKAVGGTVLAGAFAVIPMFTTQGTLYDKTKATIGELGFHGGGLVGAKIGMGFGAAVGSAVPFVGTAIGAAVGAVVGYVAGGMATQLGITKAFSMADAAVDRERNKRQMNWVGNQTAFMTQGAHTMRQQSLQAMNRGMMSARSMLGREGMMLHQ